MVIAISTPGSFVLASGGGLGFQDLPPKTTILYFIRYGGDPIPLVLLLADCSGFGHDLNKTNLSTFKATQMERANTNFGIIRPLLKTNDRTEFEFHPVSSEDFITEYESEVDFTIRAKYWGSGDVNCCTYFGEDGSCWWSSGQGTCNEGDDTWSGIQGMGDDADMVGGLDTCTVGMLLDLGAGILTVYKNNHRLGVMKRGLTGEYCWMVTPLFVKCTISFERAVPPE